MAVADRGRTCGATALRVVAKGVKLASAILRIDACVHAGFVDLPSPHGIAQCA